MHSLIQGKQQYMALKFIINKVYDLVEWHFLKAIMTKMCFHLSWNKMNISSISSISYSILVNGAPQPSFKTSRGIRQGSPDFLYL